MAALEQERTEFIKLKQQLEAEFNQKRAKFKELYMSKEGEDPVSVHVEADARCCSPLTPDLCVPAPRVVFHPQRS